jgi:hypothetical protein
MAEERPTKAFPDGEFTAAELKGSHLRWKALLISSSVAQFCSLASVTGLQLHGSMLLHRLSLTFNIIRAVRAAAHLSINILSFVSSPSAPEQQHSSNACQ